MKAVFAKRTASVAMPGGYQVPVSEGTHWASNDAVVLQCPELFSDDPRTGVAGSPPDADEVETARADSQGVEVASAGPGERRAYSGPRPQGSRRG